MLMLLIFTIIFNDPSTTEIYTLSLHDALPISLNEAHARSERHGDTRKSEEAGQDEKAPITAPADRVTDAVGVAQEHERRERHVQAQQNGHGVGELPAGKGPEPVRHREAPVVGEGLYSNPNPHDDRKVLPRACGHSSCGCRDGQRNEYQDGGSCGTRSEERRVGKEWTSRRAAESEETKELM